MVEPSLYKGKTMNFGVETRVFWKGTGFLKTRLFGKRPGFLNDRGFLKMTSFAMTSFLKINFTGEFLKNKFYRGISKKYPTRIKTLFTEKNRSC